jgi:hypothetical protein
MKTLIFVLFLTTSALFAQDATLVTTKIFRADKDVTSLSIPSGMVYKVIEVKGSTALVEATISGSCPQRILSALKKAGFFQIIVINEEDNLTVILPNLKDNKIIGGKKIEFSIHLEIQVPESIKFINISK